MQEATEKVNLKLDAWMRDRELQLENILPKLPDEETADTLSAGTLDKEEQPLNINCMLVTAAVLSNGMLVSELQKTNILFILVTAAVLISGIVIREPQL